MFGVIFFTYISIFGGDAKAYWKTGGGGTIAGYWAFGPGTFFVHMLCLPFSKYLGLSFFTGSILFTFIGYLGLQFYYATAVNLIKTNVKVFGYKLFPLIFFFPNLHFWSSGIGKDTLSFFAVGLFVYTTFSPIKRSWAMLLSLFLMYYVRPHIAMIVLLSFGIGVFIDKRVGLFYRFLLASVFIIGVILLFDNVMAYVKLDEVSSESIDKFSNVRASNLSRSHTGSSVDITSYPLPLKVFTFLYRPLFFDIHNITAVLASFENLVLLLLSIKVFKSSPFRKFKNSPFQIKGLILFVIVGTLAFSHIMGNLGIILRMKNMMTPGLLIFIFYVLSYRHPKSILKNKIPELISNS